MVHFDLAIPTIYVFDPREIRSETVLQSRFTPSSVMEFSMAISQHPALHAGA